MRCRECGSERIATNVSLVAPGTLSASGLLGQLRARVCADCGRVDFRVENALELFLAQSRDRAGGSPAPGAAATGGAPAAANIQCPSCGSVLPAAAAVCEACGWSAAR